MGSGRGADVAVLVGAAEVVAGGLGLGSVVVQPTTVANAAATIAI
jgi:hypothetical protein